MKRLAASVAIAVTGVARLVTHHPHHDEIATAAVGPAVPVTQAVIDPPRRVPPIVVSRSAPVRRTPATTTTRPTPTTVEHTAPSEATLSVTAYCDTGTMADGRQTHPGAAASNLYPFGAVLEVPGWGQVTVEDRIGWGSQLDLYTPSCDAARQWGRRELTVRRVA